MSNVTEKFLKYVGFDTQSKHESSRFPSTEKQLVLLNALSEELRQMGVKDARTNKWGYVYATIPATKGCEKLPALGFIAHADTATEISGKDVKPRIEKNYQGGDIVLNKELGIVLSPSEYPFLTKEIGQDIIVTDGTTLLGADDKAGVAEIMELVQYLMKHPEISHCKLCIGFTPDEEVGGGVDHFDVAEFGATYAYTVDGGPVGGIDFENFNAASGKVTVTGLSIHPGSAKGRMINAMLLAMEFNSMLPANENPAYTDGYDGFYHLCTMSGDIEHARLDYIIRDHDMDKFNFKKERFQAIADYLNKKYGSERVVVEVTDSYYNMAEKIKPHYHLIDNACKAFEECGVTPEIHPIRGGTDGARLSFMGLPCPNLSTGGYCYHGRFENISVQSMEKMVDVLLKVVENYSA